MTRYSPVFLNFHKPTVITFAIAAAFSIGTVSNAAVIENSFSASERSLDVTLTGTLGSGDTQDRYGWIVQNGWLWTGNKGEENYYPNKYDNLNSFTATYGTSTAGVTGTPTLIAGILANASITMTGSVLLDLTQYVDVPQTIFYGVMGYTDGYISDTSNPSSPNNIGRVNNQTFTIDGDLTLNISPSAAIGSVYGISTGHPGTLTGVINTLNVGGTVSINYSSSDTTSVATNIIGAEVLQGGTITVGNVQINLTDVAPTGYVYGAIVSSDSTSNASLTLTNGVTVNVAGLNSAELESTFVPNSIYGVVNGSSTSSAFKLGANATNHRTLNLGTSSNPFTTSGLKH